ncbi:uncharacterized protein LOC109720943 [Ananas comosus]|uniref:Uncharacterized protein LOC109720943 n=1 Tax=Ananas comosus TaxID=4615 RepID=A0A6P5GEW2_ANACO|nr:uncharacterized protein LOC109720943 [Ananas comosus]
MAPLAPLSEEPISEEDSKKSLSKRSHSFSSWMRSHLPLLFNKKSDLRILLSVIGCPLSPVPVLPMQFKNVASSAQYIIQQFRATTGCAKIEGSVKSMYAAGRVGLVMRAEAGRGRGRGGAPETHGGCFVLWQMAPGMWLVELAVAGHQVVAGSDGTVPWRRTPWLGAHAARGGVRPLRRALQGLDPVTIAAVFSPAEHVGEKQIGEDHCFILKLEVDASILSSLSDGTAEIIKHGMVGYFSQKSGLLVQLEDSQLTRIQSPGAQATYWETTISSTVEDYRQVDGVMIAHAGRSTVSLIRFGIGLKVSRVVTQMEETWAIDDVVFNVPGLSPECFLPPEEVQRSRFYETAFNQNIQ